MNRFKDCIVCKYLHSEFYWVWAVKAPFDNWARVGGGRVTLAPGSGLRLRHDDRWLQSHRGRTDADIFTGICWVSPTSVNSLDPHYCQCLTISTFRWDDFVSQVCSNQHFVTEKRKIKKVFNLHFCLLVFFVTVLKLVCLHWDLNFSWDLMPVHFRVEEESSSN